MEKPQEMRQLDSSETPNKSVATEEVKSEGDSFSESEREDKPSINDKSPALKSLQALELKTAKKLSKSNSEKTSARRSRPDIGTFHFEKDLHQLQKDFETAQNELKLAYRENRDQSLELRDLRKINALSHEKNLHLREHNAELREAYRARSGSEKISKGEKVKYMEHIEILEGHISHLQYERQKREGHLDFLTEQTREANEEKSATESECRKLQRQIRDLSAHLTECKDDLLRLQPISQVPDNEISDQYSNLDQQITGWVDDETEDSQLLEDQFEKLKAPEDLPDLFKDYLSAAQLRMGRKYPESQPILLRYLIYRYLDTFVFDDDNYLFGLDARSVALMKGLEEGMKVLEPRRDAVTIRRWRSESLCSLLQIPTFISEQERQAQLISQTLRSALSRLITDTPETEAGWEDLHTQIVLPAISIATKFRLSTADYRLVSHIFARKSTSSIIAAYVHQIKDSSMIDIATHKILRQDSILKVGDDGRIGEEVLVVAPALLRAHTEGKILICKPTRLVKLDEPMGKRNRGGIKALGSWTPSWFGGEDGAA